MSTLSNYYIISLIINNNIFPQPPPSSWFSIFLLFKVCSSCNFHSALKHFLFVSHLFSQLCKSKRETGKKTKIDVTNVFWPTSKAKNFETLLIFLFKTAKRGKILSISLHNYRPYEHLISNFTAWLKAKRKKTTYKQKDRGVSSDRNLNIFTVKNYFSVVLFFSCAM